MQEAVERLQAAGFADGATVTIEGAHAVEVTQLALEEPITVGPFTLQVRADSVRIPIDPWALGSPGLPIAGAIEVQGVHVKLGQATAGKAAAKQSPSDSPETPSADDITFQTYRDRRPRRKTYRPWLHRCSGKPRFLDRNYPGCRDCRRLDIE